METSVFTPNTRVHMIGIKGAGMTALAELLTLRGAHITGSDVPEKFYTDALLKKLGIKYRESFDPKNIPAKTDIVIYSTAYSKEKNPELAHAHTLGIPVMSYPQAVGKLTETMMTLAVCGTHGKTTTSALLADTLRAIGADPSAIVGSRIVSWNGSALAGRGKYLVLEADEYQNKLAEYAPFGVILTSVDWDHPDFFKTKEAYLEVFKAFVMKIPRHGILVYCSDSRDVIDVALEAECQKFSYGFLEGADFLIQNNVVHATEGVLPQDGITQTFTVNHAGTELGEFSLQLAGRHNALNATAVIALLTGLRENTEKMEKALSRFRGTERRFEYLGERFGALVYDDYAHHPEEIRTTLQAFRALYPKRRLKVFFHPHTFTRTKALLDDFAQSFDDADQIWLLPIYGSAREKQGGVSSEDLADKINRYFPGKAQMIPDDREAFLEEFQSGLGKNDLVVTLGAGDVWKLSHKLARKS